MSSAPASPFLDEAMPSARHYIDEKVNLHSRLASATSSSASFASERAVTNEIRASDMHADNTKEHAQLHVTGTNGASAFAFPDVYVIGSEGEFARAVSD